VEQSDVNKNGATILVPKTTVSLFGTTSELVDQEIDTVREKTFSGSVIAKDSTTVAVGGLIDEGAANLEKKTPFLGDIPLLGFFFRDEAQSRTRTELVIIIKPHIITSPAEAQVVSQKLMKENSIHPNAEKLGTMGVYSNPDKVYKGYKLDEPFKQYNNQDTLDRYKWDNPNPRR
jgi:general secretion pathway protein D